MKATDEKTWEDIAWRYYAREIEMPRLMESWWESMYAAWFEV
jgi:hypothetical protein